MEEDFIKFLFLKNKDILLKENSDLYDALFEKWREAGGNSNNFFKILFTG